MVGAPTAGGDRHPDHGDGQTDTDDHSEREDPDIQKPQWPAEPTDFSGRARGRATVRAGNEQAARDRDAGAERRKDCGHGDRLPQHHRCAGGAQRPRCPRKEARYRADQHHRESGEGKPGHGVSLP
jgi:hypothetical protein